MDVDTEKTWTGTMSIRECHPDVIGDEILLIIRVDPRNSIIEKDETNNSAEIWRTLPSFP